MPRPNAPRTIASESNLATRITRERKRRAMSYEALARAMTDAGCAIDRSAIYRIEKGEPPRKVTVDELVALSVVFGESIDELLSPSELVDQRRAREVVQRLQEAAQLVSGAAQAALRSMIELKEMSRDDADLSEYVGGHIQGYATYWDQSISDRYVNVTGSPADAEWALSRITNGIAEWWGTVDDVAELLVRLERGEVEDGE